jgi:hypothetical protein
MIDGEPFSDDELSNLSRLSTVDIYLLFLLRCVICYRAYEARGLFPKAITHSVLRQHGLRAS